MLKLGRTWENASGTEGWERLLFIKQETVESPLLAIWVRQMEQDEQ